jgi:hypothetical protein
MGVRSLKLKFNSILNMDNIEYIHGSNVAA